MNVNEKSKGIMKRIMKVFQKKNINIERKFIKKDGEVGYIVMEEDGVGEERDEVLKEIREIKGKIRDRMI